MPWSTEVEGTVEIGDVTYFEVKVKSDGQEWSIQKRYTEFVQLHSQLSFLYDFSLASLPSKDSLGIRRRLGFLNGGRQRALDEYLAHLKSQIEPLASNVTLHKFLTQKDANLASVCEPSAGDADGNETNDVQVASSPHAVAVASGNVVGPKVYVIVKPKHKAGILPKVRNQLIGELMNGVGVGLVVDRVAFPKESPLHEHEVFSVGATFDTLLDLAEYQGISKILAEDSVPLEYRRQKGTRAQNAWFPFSKAKLRTFAGSEEPLSFFSPFEVVHLLCKALNSAHAAGLGKHPVLLAAKVAGELDCIMALHDHEELKKQSVNWVSAFNIKAEPPVAEIASYFGPGGALYYAYMYQYARWLVLPAVICLGLVIGFQAWQCSTGSNKAFATTWFSYAATLLVTVWSTLFSARCKNMVKVYLSELGHDIMKRQRNTFDASTADVYFSFKGLHVTKDRIETLRKKQEGDGAHLLSYVVMVLAMAVLFAITALVIGALLWVGDWTEKQTSNVILQNLPIVLYLVVVGLFEIFYRWLAVKLTEFERHRMYSEYLKSLTLKSAAFNIMNTLGWFFYVAFWQRNMVYLRGQLLLYFTVKQVIGNITETGVPWLKNWWRRRGQEAKATGALRSKSPEDVARRKNTPEDADGAKLRSAIEDQWQSEVPNLGDDFTEVATLYAAAIWFSPVFPLGMLLALIHAVTEAMSDRYKMCFVSRRALPDYYFAVSYDAWLLIISAIGCIGVPINIALTYIAHEGAWDAWELVGIEHAILFVKLYLLISIPNEPEWLNYRMSHLKVASPKVSPKSQLCAPP